MELVEFLDEESEKKARKHITDAQASLGLIQGKDEERFYLIEEDIFLHDFDEIDIKYRVLNEEEIKSRLPPKRFQLYNFFKREISKTAERMNAPTGHVVAQFSVDESRLGDLEKIIKTYTTHKIFVEPSGIRFVPPYLERIEDGKDKIVTAYIPRDKKENFTRTLADAKIAGYSRETQVLFRDPDRKI